MTSYSCNAPQPKIVLDRINQLITAAHQSAPTPFEIAASIAHRFNNDQTRFDPLATLGLFLPSRLILPTLSQQPTFDHTPVPHSIQPITYDQHRSAVIRFFDTIYPSTFYNLMRIMMHVLDTHSLLDPPTSDQPGIHRYQLSLIIATFISIHPFIYGTERLHKLAIRRSQSESERIKHIKTTSHTTLKRWSLLSDPIPLTLKSQIKYTGTQAKLFPLAFYTDNIRRTMYSSTPYTNPSTTTKQSKQIHLPNPIPLTTLIPDFLHFFGYVFIANDVSLHPLPYLIDDPRRHLFYRTHKPSSIYQKQLNNLQSYIQSNYQTDTMVILDPVTLHTNVMQGISSTTIHSFQRICRHLYTEIHDLSSSLTMTSMGEMLTKILESIQFGLQYRNEYSKQYMNLMLNDTMIREKFDLAMKWVTCGMDTDGDDGGLTGSSSMITMSSISVSSTSSSNTSTEMVMNTDSSEIIVLE